MPTEAPLMNADLLLCIEALVTIVEESDNAEIVRVALTALINVPGGPQQLQARGLAL